ncbi:hypothetical protein DRJ19_00240 [Candidatus Woesearchaeota archaeon]|nr:MAG: hypothetical protein DRJ19_00240 [Candidatus Woesearchaeota archaeon]
MQIDLRILFVVILAAVLLLLFYIIKIIQTDVLSRKFYAYGLCMLLVWNISDFMFAFASNEALAHTFYFISMLAIGLMSGFFYLAGYTLAEKCKLTNYWVAALPTVLNFLRLPLQEVVPTAIGSFALKYNVFDYAWMVLCILLMLDSCRILLQLRSRIRNIVLIRRINTFVYTIICVGFAGAIFTTIFNMFHLPDITAGIAGLLAFLTYPLFGGGK